MVRGGVIDLPFSDWGKGDYESACVMFKLAQLNVNC